MNRRCFTVVCLMGGNCSIWNKSFTLRVATVLINQQFFLKIDHFLSGRKKRSPRATIAHLSTYTYIPILNSNSSWKMDYFTFFPFKSSRDHICREIGQGQPKVIIWTNLKVFNNLILHAEFHGNSPPRPTPNPRAIPALKLHMKSIENGPAFSEVKSFKILTDIQS